MNAQRCDRLIVGSGTASCVLANALSSTECRSGDASAGSDSP